MLTPALMLSGLLLLQSVPVGPPALPMPGTAGPRPDAATLYEACVTAVSEGQADLAERFARAWIAENRGGVPARQCLGLAQNAQGRHADAMRSFAEAARAGEQEKNPRVAELWGQAGNAALLAGNPAEAVTYFTSGLAAAGAFAPRLSAGLLVDRARALVEAGNLVQARRDLDRARALDPEDKTAALLSAALARREGDLGRAQREIAAASAMAPNDPDIMFEQGNIAALAGDTETARRVFEALIQSAPGSEAAKLARARLQP
ncbi:tetratricopeptide repeat protein [Thermaurantiacus sp.]